MSDLVERACKVLEESCLKAFEAGKQSRDAEISRLKSENDEHRKRRYQLTKQLIQKSLCLTDAEFEYKRIKSERAKDVLTIMRLTARNEKLQEELKALRGDHE